MKKKKLIFIIIAISIVLIAFLALNTYIYQQKQSSTSSEITTYRASLTGTYTCLPKKQSSIPQTEECMYGIETEVGEYYSMNLQLMSQPGIDLQAGDQFKANGVITPIEMLSTDHWQQYDIKGIFSVTDSIEKIPN